VAVGSVIARIITQYSDKGSKAAQRDITKLGKQFDEFGKRVFKAFAVAGAAAAAFAVKIGKDAVQAAMEDQKSQLLLANALRNTVNATDENIAATEAYISAMQRQFAIADDDLRPSLAALAAVTGDLAQAQGLQNIAIDVAAGTGKDLASVTQAIVKAYQGNLGALRRLGVPLDENIVKSKDFNAAMQELAGTFAGAGATSANTFAGRLRGLQLTYTDIIEQLGYALIPVLQNLATFIINDILPALEAWISANKDRVATSLQSVIDNSIKAGKAIARFFGFISDNLQVIKNLGALLFGIFAGAKVYAGIVAITTAVNLLRTAFIKQAAAAGTAAIATAAATGGASLLAAGAAIVAFTAATGVALATLNNIEETTGKTKKNLQAQRQSIREIESRSSKVAGFNRISTNFTNQNLGATKKLSAEQQKRLETQKAINKAQLDEFGIKNVSTTDPISLEAARLNLVKEGQLVEVKRLEAMQRFYEQQAAVNLLSARYADILSVINDRQVSPAEVGLLATKWGETEEAVIKYLAYVTKAPLPEGWNDAGNQAAQGWNTAIQALNNYYRALGQTPIPTLPGVTGGGATGGGAGGGAAGGGAGGGLVVPEITPTPIPSISIPTGGEMFAGTPLAGITAQDLAEAFGLSSISDLRSFGVQGNPQVTVNINSAQGEPWSDEVGNRIVEKIIDYSAIGYSTGWYRTTGNVAV
jgi:hypothetical protein